MNLTASTIANAIGLDTAVDDTTLLSHLLTDSRQLTYPENTVFFALRTKVNDGHRYIADLYDAGVRYFVIDEDIDTGEYPGATFWKVDDALQALQTLAAYVRDCETCGATVVGITGSRGKTVVKELIYLALLKDSDIFTTSDVVRSPRSYNSQIGVPLSVWEMCPSTKFAVFEAGISRAGEMKRLAEIINPEIGVFTSLTDEHDDGFDSLEQKAQEKALLFAHCPTVFVSADTPNSDIMIKAVAKANPDANIIPVSGGNKAIAEAVVECLLSTTMINSELVPDAPETMLMGGGQLVDGLFYLGKAKEIIKSASENISSRIAATDTLKDCTIVYDSFTNDLRSLQDALNATTRHLAPPRSLTLILNAPDISISKSELIRLLQAKGVSRFIGIGSNFDNLYSEDICMAHVGTVEDFINQYTISDFANEVILVKDSNHAEAEDIKTLLEAPRHETVMEVDLGAITKNFNFFRSKIRPETGVVCMVKAEGYGVGALELAKTLQSQGASYLAVAVIDEGVALRRGGITMPIIVMNPVSTNYKALFDYKLEPSVFSLRELDLLISNAGRLGIKDYPVHIKLDTGMHRLGFVDTELDALIERLKGQNQVKVRSIFSHLATADCLDQDAYTQGQLDSFERMSSKITSSINYPVLRHILNTAGILRYPQYQYDMVRLGIGLYGVAPIDGYKLAPVARLVSTIISIKEWGAGITIGYGRKGRITDEAVIATVPIGYADGLDRHLSNHNAYVMVNGYRCDIVGNICMDQCMIDITGTGAQIGDTVEIFGPTAPIERLSDTLGTIPYEILTSISPRVKRIYFRD